MRFLTLCAEFRAEGAVRFPDNPVNTLRGALGFHLKRAVCIRKHGAGPVGILSCRGCPLERACVYSAVFETPVTSDGTAQATSGGQDAPHPVVWWSEFDGPCTIAGHGRFRFGFTWFGRAVDTIPYFVYALGEAGRSGFTRDRVPCSLQTVTLPDENHHPVWDPSTGTVEPLTARDLDVAEPETFTGECIKLGVRFKTPVSFKDRASGKIVNLPAFDRVVRSLLRRHTALLGLEGNPAPAWDYAGIIRKAAEIRLTGPNLKMVSWERFSSRQKTRAFWGGSVGTVCYEGDLRPFLPLLRAGERLHVGRGTAFGQGRYELLEPPGDDRPTSPGHTDRPFPHESLNQSCHGTLPAMRDR